MPAAPPPLPDGLLLSCEHASARVPARWQRLLAAHLPAAAQRALKAALLSHRGFDAGALSLARCLGRRWRLPVYAGKSTRLLVDLNRSLGHPDCLSPYTKVLPAALQAALVAELYAPHRQAVQAAVARALGRHGRLVHLALHSFTPRWRGRLRAVDVGVLYDPKSPHERWLAGRLVAACKERLPRLRIRRNAPYRGVADGLPTALRRQAPAWTRTFRAARRPAYACGYAGLELEVNQALVQADGWPAVRAALVAALSWALREPFQ